MIIWSFAEVVALLIVSIVISNGMNATTHEGASLYQKHMFLRFLGERQQGMNIPAS